MIRIQLEVSDKRFAELVELMTETNTTTKKDLLNDALTLFEWAVRERQAGRDIVSRDELGGATRCLLMPSLERAAKKVGGAV